CESDDVVIRMGGDEFVVIVRDPDRLDPVMARIATAQLAIGVSLSLGTATRGQGQSIDAVIASADQQLYARRAHSRGTLRNP
ncbi:MAG: diguanylate cyclase, partial [Luteibacter sp.]